MQQGNASHNQQVNASLRTAILTLWLAPTYYAAVEQRAALPEMRRCRLIPVKRVTGMYTISATMLVTQRVKWPQPWNSPLFPLMFSYRLTVGRQQTSRNVGSLSAVQDSLFFTIVTAERKLARNGFRPRSADRFS